MTFRKQPAIAIFAVAFAFLVCARPASAAVVYDSAGFESPRFIPGDLAGQDTQGPWLKDSGTGTGIVQSAVTRGGAQAVRIDRSAALTGDTRFGVQKPLTPVPGLQLLRVSWDMNVTQNQNPQVDFGPFFGVEGYDAFGGVPKLIGSLGVDAQTGDVLIQQTDTGFFIDTGIVVPRGQWQHFALEMNYATGMYQAFVNGVAAGDPEPFVDPGIVGFTDAPMATLAASELGLTAPGTAYFDNYSIEIVPEPTTVAIMGLASLGLLRRRRAAR
jgi:PEP-CTERM motif